MAKERSREKAVGEIQSMKSTVKKQNRYLLLDTIRGITLISMILYHGCWNLVYLYGMEWEWYQFSKGAHVWQQSICQTFIFLSGFCFSLGKRRWRNGSVIFFSGILVSLVTYWFMPENAVRFGILTCIGSCLLITAFLDKIFRYFPKAQSTIVMLLLFLITKQVNSGWLGGRTFVLKMLPKEWYSSFFSAYLGFPPESFSSTDYFSLVPWIFLYWAGYFFYLSIKKKGFWKKEIMQLKLPMITKMGQHSLFIYLIHQPILYMIGEAMF